jgi:hypothetical protein
LALSGQINSICSASDEHSFAGIAENQCLLDERNYSVRKNSIVLPREQVSKRSDFLGLSTATVCERSDAPKHYVAQRTKPADAGDVESYRLDAVLSG